MIQPAFASSSLETLQARAHDKHLAGNSYWHRLLHYRRNLLGRYQSEIDDPSFFISPQGRRDPAAELNATLAAYFQTPAPETETSQAARCRYPLRYAWLQEQLGFSDTDVPQPACGRYDKWRAQLDPESVALVFASSYMNNPSSMYGHTFLLLKKKGLSPQNQLLNYVVNFAADLEGDNGALYALKGLAGGYHGRFSSFPYYIKVQEYNNLDYRDLWEYDLHLSSAAIQRLTQHLWELGNVRIPYFFLNKNCSYYLMPLLEVVEPERHFKDAFILKAVPVDTVRAVIAQPGILETLSRRASLTHKMLSERARLDPSEVNLAEALVHDPGSAAKSSAFTALPPEEQAMTLDTAYDYLTYQSGTHTEQPKAIEDKKQDLLLIRSKITAPTPALVISTATAVAPHVGHRTGRLGLSYGFSNHSHFEEVSLRPAIHDQDDPPEGYLPGSKLEMFHPKIRYDNDRRTAYLEQFAVIDMVSITPWDRWIHPPSWKVNSGVSVAHDLNRDPENSLFYGLNLGTGYSSWAPGTEKILFYGMGEMVLELGHAYTHDVRFGGGPSGGILFQPLKYYRARFQASYFPYAAGRTPATAKLGLYQSVSVMKDLDIRVKLERQNQYKEVLFTLAWFM